MNNFFGLKSISEPLILFKSFSINLLNVDEKIH